jgi:hypothetical protein
MLRDIRGRAIQAGGTLSESVCRSDNDDCDNATGKAQTISRIADKTHDMQIAPIEYPT